MTGRVRLTREQRQEVIIDAACRLTARLGSVYAFNRADLANECVPKTSRETTKLCFRDMDDLRAIVLARA